MKLHNEFNLPTTQNKNVYLLLCLELLFELLRENKSSVHPEKKKSLFDYGEEISKILNQKDEQYATTTHK